MICNSPVLFAIFKEHKRSLETLAFQKDRKTIEDADGIPQEAKELMKEYRETKQSELLYIKVFRIMSVFVLVSLVICYIRNETENRQGIIYVSVQRSMAAAGNSPGGIYHKALGRSFIPVRSCHLDEFAGQLTVA